jgi:apolipoprotein N-acyltransferase
MGYGYDWAEYALAGLGGLLGVIITIAVIYALAVPIFSAWLASKKGYSGVAWFFLALFFGLIAFLALGFAPLKRPSAGA